MDFITDDNMTLFIEVSGKPSNTVLRCNLLGHLHINLKYVLHPHHVNPTKNSSHKFAQESGTQTGNMNEGSL